MRRVLLGVLGVVIASDAFAADWLRGSSYEGPSRYEEAARSYHWGGAYVGGQVGYSETTARFYTTPRDFIDPLVRPTREPVVNLSTWPSLDKSDVRGSGYGGFIGYNSQWGEAILGIELNYSRLGLRASSLSTSYISTSASTGIPGSFSRIDYTADMTLTDLVTGRLRAGYAWNWFMPYGFIGAAVGRADLARSATVSYSAPLPCVPPAPCTLPYTDTQTRNGAIMAGYTAGFGVDIGLMANVFLRAEYEFVQLSKVEGVEAQVNSVRAAAAVKF